MEINGKVWVLFALRGVREVNILVIDNITEKVFVKRIKRFCLKLYDVGFGIAIYTKNACMTVP